MGPVIIPKDWETWVEDANGSGFGLQNLPIGCGLDGTLYVRIGKHALPVAHLPGGAALADAWHRQVDLLATQRAIRSIAAEALKVGGQESLIGHLVSVDRIRMGLPTRSRGFIDFYAGIHHASNVGKMFRPDQPPLLPNYRHLPIAYNGRSSSLVPSHASILRPWGQQRVGDQVVFEPTRELDFELELGWYIGRSSRLGEPVGIDEAGDYLLGIVLVNDWSARDVQRWEYQPLGPFLAKSFATSVSPWLAAWDALQPFFVEGLVQDPTPLPHLRTPSPSQLDLDLSVELNGETISNSNARHLYWSIPQQLAHLTSNGANVEAGDLMATGTISGPEEGTFGSMLELSWRGTQPIRLASGDERTFLQDGDRVALKGAGESNGCVLDLGEVENVVLPARA